MEDAFRLDDATYADFLAREQPESEDEAEARRVRGIEEALAAFPAANAKVREVYGFELPRTLFVFDAFWRSLSPAERDAYDRLELPRPAGLLEWFRSGGTERRVRDGLDARLHWRWRCDPPELVTVLVGGSDAEHYGLFYDDPGKLPAGVALSYARDSAETWWHAPTVLDVIREHLDDIEEESLTPDYHDDVARAACQLRLLREAVEAFFDVEQEATEADEPRLAMPYNDRIELPSIVSGVGVLVPGARQRAPHVAELDGVSRPFADLARTRRFVDEARAALDRGAPAYALALGRDLHWADGDDLRGETLELLVRAYEMLGRHALARVVEVHHAHRDLADVTVLLDE